MSADLQNRAEQAVEMLRTAGADDAWATAVQSRDVEFNYRDGALEKVKDTTSRMLAIQVYANGRYSSHQTTDLNPDRLGGFLQEAVDITGALEPDEQRALTAPELFANRPNVDLDLVDGNVQSINREQRIQWCETLDDNARQHERVISATSSVNDGSQTIASASSNGFSGVQESTYCWLGAYVTLSDQGDRRAADGLAQVHHMSVNCRMQQQLRRRRWNGHWLDSIQRKVRQPKQRCWLTRVLQHSSYVV
jgi:PmbA protein